MLSSKTTTTSQYQPTVLITTQHAHPWTISGFNGLNGNVLLTFKCDAPVVSHGLLCSRDHIYAAAIDRPSIYVWNLNSRNRDYKKMTVAGPISCMTFIRDSTVLACAIGNKIFLYKLDNGQHLITLSAHIRTINHLLFDEDQDCLISAGEDNLIHRWNIEDINLDRNIDVSPTKSFQGHTGPIHDVCQISIGKFHLILTASSDLSVRLWDIITGKCLCTFLFPNEIHSICASSFATTIYCGTDVGTIFSVPLRTLTTQFGGFLHQNPTITIDSNNSKQFVHHQGSVVALRLSADEQILYSGSLDKDCVMWDLSSGQIRFKKSCSSSITNILLAKIDTDDVHDGSSISIPFSTFSNNSNEEVVAHTLAARNGSSQRPICSQDSIKFIPMPPVNGELDESVAMAAPTFAQMARLLLEQQMNSS
ncbi:unnamed protein product [Adineta steineri]|uniref:Uncharacterized protein n=2 Tax=Adineta steineri TaxID=433720 RepID=A0A819E6E0_9BILA|nr:unnamed protein product [Adineta steineri]CAF1190229.1 unnamed protein product [Adineta steineri]CAF1252112.1 unnamed protein product [Adineta steineri]CAF3713374.1 unnamed protein product [Adineta steineri]CAF3810045.1 unnamed protein product [Adineta steineri]